MPSDPNVLSLQAQPPPASRALPTSRGESSMWQKTSSTTGTQPPPVSRALPTSRGTIGICRRTKSTECVESRSSACDVERKSEIRLFTKDEIRHRKISSYAKDLQNLKVRQIFATSLLVDEAHACVASHDSASTSPTQRLLPLMR